MRHEEFYEIPKDALTFGGLRSMVVATARECIGTPYHHQGRLKYEAMDCLGLILCVADELGLKDRNGLSITKSQYHSYSEYNISNVIQMECAARLVPKDTRQPGDVITIRLSNRATCHVGIVSNLGIIHCLKPYGVVEHLIDDKWQRRIVGIFGFPECV